MNFKEARANKTQQEVSDATGISQKTLSNYETGRTEPDLNSLIKLADFYNVSVDFLLDRKSKNQLDLVNLSISKKEAIEKLLACNDRMCDRVSAYIDVLNDRELAEDISKFKHNDDF